MVGIGILLILMFIIVSQQVLVVIQYLEVTVILQPLILVSQPLVGDDVIKLSVISQQLVVVEKTVQQGIIQQLVEVNVTHH